MSKINDFIRDNVYVFKLAGSVLGIIGLFTAFDSYLDSKIENKITDTEYVKKLSNQLRLFLLFDSSGVVSYDHGAFDKIENIIVDGENEFIIIETSEFMQSAPLLVTFGAHGFSFKVERMESKKWKYNFLYNKVLTMGGGSKEKPNMIFMLEILQ